MPPLLRSATVRKFMDGYELLHALKAVNRDIPVVLLIGSVELEQLDVAFVEMVDRVGDFRINRSLEKVATLFD